VDGRKPNISPGGGARKKGGWELLGIERENSLSVGWGRHFCPGKHPGKSPSLGLKERGENINQIIEETDQ